MRKKIMTLMMGTLLLLTACGQTGSNSASTMLPVAAVQSAAQAIAPVEDKTQEDVEILPAEEGVEEVKGADDKETPNPAEDADTPSAKTEETSTTPAGEGQSDAPEPPTAPKEPATPVPAPEDKPTPAPTPAPTQKPAEKQEEEPVPEPVPAPEPKPEPADRWAAVSAANAYAVTQYGVITDGSLTLDNSAYRFPASVAADASQEALEAKARDMVDYTFRQLMMQAGMDSIADAGFHCNVCIVEDGISLLIYVLYAG
mgnify:CR=1 FL=1|jgi:outer membrane biosynthesis protein TonB